jgi:hypothetical protein
MADEAQVNSDPENPSDTEKVKPAPPDKFAVAEEDLDLEARKKLGGEIDNEYTSWRTPRRTHELQWFITAAYKRGKQSNEALQTLSSMQDITKLDRKKKNIANVLWSKHRARFAKFARTRPKGFVVPFNTDRKSRLDARATEKALGYFYERAEQEQAYLDVIQHAGETGKAYWWLYWNPTKKATIRRKNEITGTVSIEDAEAQGDIELQVGNAFEVLVPDLRTVHLKDQSKMMRVRVQDVADMKARFSKFAGLIRADQQQTSPFEFERQIAHLSGSEAGALASMSTDMKGPATGVLVKEEYTKPNATYPHGRYVVVMNGYAVHVQSELPYGFADLENPYPVAEFMDMPAVGQFYVTTFIEQLIPLQRGYNMIRDKLEKSLQMGTHWKWVVTKQARIPKGALTNEAAEVVEWNFIPGMPEPHPVQPGNVAADAWRFAQMLLKEFDQISQVQPTFEGRAGGTKSGIHANLLQEASDSVHSPDARGFELAVLDASYKIRRMMKAGYDVPRMMSYAGRNQTPEVFEFSTQNIDEHATIVIQIGSALSTFKATQIQQLLELHEKGLLGDPNDPELKRRVLGMLDIGGLEQLQEAARMDEDMARAENIDILTATTNDIQVPMFYEDHIIHYAVHTEELKSPANKDLHPDVKKRMIAHTLLHMKWINPQAAFNLANELGMQELIRPGLIPPPPPMPPVPAGSGGPLPTPPNVAGAAPPTPPIAGPAAGPTF